MTIKIPKELGREYWIKSEQERFDTWKKFLVNELNITESEAEGKIQHIRSLPLIYKWPKRSPRLEAAAQTLYEASPKCPYHNRRHGAMLASTTLICKISGANCSNQEKYWDILLRRMYGSISKLHVKLKFSESCAYGKETLLERFSHEDIRRGVLLPKFTGECALRCLGYSYGDGRLSTERYTLTLQGREVDYQLYGIIRLDFDEAFNLWKEINTENREEKEEFLEGRNVRFGKYSYPVLAYTSKAVWKWFRNLGFPVKGEEKHLPPSLSEKTNTLKREFTKAIISTIATFCEGKLTLNDNSKSILGDYENLFSDIGIECCTPYKRPKGEGCHLVISSDSTKKLWEHGYCSLNPWLQTKTDEFYKNS